MAWPSGFPREPSGDVTRASGSARLMRNHDRELLSKRRKRLRSRGLETISQELSQPADALGLLTRALRRRAVEGESEVILDEVETGLRQMRRQVTSLVDLLRAEHCLEASERVEFPLMPLFEKLALQMGRLAYDNRVQLVVVPTTARVVSDPAAVEVILRNLLVNALFFAQGRALLGCRRRGGSAVVQGWDNGIGIAPEDQAVIFEPLKKLCGGDELVQGLGVGLSIARDLAQALGHELNVRSAPSRGSAFSLTVPRSPDRPERR